VSIRGQLSSKSSYALTTLPMSFRANRRLRKRMRILHVVTSLDPDAGGPAAVAVRLAAGHRLLGHEANLCCYQAPGKSAAIVASFRRVPGFDQIQQITMPPAGRIERILASSARATLRRAIADTDLVYLHGVWDPILKAAGDVSISLGKHYFVMPHGMLDPWSLNQKRFKKKLALLLGYRRVLDRATALHVLNSDEGDLIRPLHLSAPSVVIPNGIFEEELTLPPDAQSFQAFFPQLRDRPFILFLSRLHTKKGLDVLADAFAIVAKQHDQVQLVVAGPNGDATADFDARIARAGITHRVHRIGPIYGDTKLAAYRAATCFCLPSLQEGFSLAVTEALAVGLPVVITPGVHFPEVATAGAGEVVDRNADAVAASLLKIIRDPSLRQQMSDAGRRLISTQYTWRHIAQQTIDAFNSIGKSRSNPG
jgi:glycosyltransferase involved in cell wall biosynthesis